MNTSDEILKRFRDYLKKAGRNEKTNLKIKILKFLNEEIELYRLVTQACEERKHEGNEVDTYEYCLTQSRLIAFLELRDFISRI